MRRAAYKPAPGTTASRVVELLRFLPQGSAVYSSDLCKRLGLHPNCGINSHLLPALRHGLVQYEARKGRRGKVWLVGDGVPHQLPAIRPPRVKRHTPLWTCPPARSVFELAKAYV